MRLLYWKIVNECRTWIKDVKICFIVSFILICEQSCMYLFLQISMNAIIHHAVKFVRTPRGVTRVVVMTDSFCPIPQNVRIITSVWHQSAPVISNVPTQSEVTNAPATTDSF